MLTKYCKVFPDQGGTDSLILFSTRKASVIKVPATMLKEIEKGNLSAEEQGALGDLGFHVESLEKEQEKLLGFLDDLNKVDTILAVKIVMNLDCNLSCIYCFEGRRKGNFFLTKDTALEMVSFIEGILVSKKKRELRVTFYGGEPLLSAELLLFVSRWLKEMTESIGVVYTAFIITNGTLLTPKMAERLNRLGLTEAAVTLDGPRLLHDFFRPYRSGRGSFDRIVANLKETCRVIRIQIGGNFTKDNYHKMPYLLDHLLSIGLTPDRIPLVRFDPVIRESDDIAPPDFRDGCDCYNEPWMVEASLYLREDILKRGYRTMKVMPRACLLDLSDRLIVSYDGKIYKCPGFIGREKFCVGDVRNGITDYSRSHNLDNWKNGECLDCSYLPLCFGGCRYMKFVRDGNMEGVDCRKPYLDAALEAMVKQDIKYGLV